MKKIILLTFLPFTVLADCLPSETANLTHIEHSRIIAGDYDFNDIIEHGKMLFTTKANACDGLGRPATTGSGEKREAIQPSYTRISGPDSNTCSGCHAQQKIGGSGDFVANVFVLVQTKDPILTSIAGDESNERNTLGMWGSGSIEMLAREMTEELQSKSKTLPDGIFEIKAKGIEFKIEKQNGKVVKAWGVDPDLVIKPFHQSCVVVSLRQFTVQAFNHHHGLQAEERFYEDFDEDGIDRELTTGDITATTLWQANLLNPKQVLPKNTEELNQVKNGEKLFNEIGCSSCHLPSLTLKSKTFTEPNPYNPPQFFSDKNQSYSFELQSNKVKAYTDLKRHNLCDPIDQKGAIRFFCNEKLDQNRPDQDGNPGSEYFITRKLWDVGDSAPYGHRGDLSTISEAIEYHGGEGRKSRDKFVELFIIEQKSIISFLKTLRSR